MQKPLKLCTRVTPIFCLLFVFATYPISSSAQTPPNPAQEPLAADKEPSAADRKPSAADKKPSESKPSTDSANSASAPTPASQTSEPRAMIDTNERYLKLLAEEVDEAALQWLETTDGKFMAIWEPDKTGKPFGAALLLHGDGESTDSPHTLRALRGNLSTHGWATLAISLPPAAKRTVPPRPVASTSSSEADPAAPAAEASTGNADTADTADSDDPEEISKRRLRAAIAFLNQQGQYNIVIIGHGLGAFRAALFINSLSAGSKSTKPTGSAAGNRAIRAFVMVQARNRFIQSDESIASYLNDSTLPVLDIYYGDHYLDDLEVKQRRKIARDKQIEHYFQVKIMRPTLSDSDSGNRLTRRVRGFLSQHAKGVAIERRGR